MGLQPRADYTRFYAMGNAVLPKLRKLVGGDMLHWSDRDLGNILDMAVHKQIKNGNEELWWEDDFAYGINLNHVVRIDEYLPAGVNYNVPPLYAIVRRASRDDVDIIISIVDEERYDKAIINRRWTETRPEKSRYRHPGESEEETKEQEPIVTSTEQPDTTVAEQNPPVLLIVYTTHHSDGEKILTWKCSESELHAGIMSLLNRGINPEYIEVWRNCSAVEVGISFKPL